MAVYHLPIKANKGYISGSGYNLSSGTWGPLGQGFLFENHCSKD